MWRQTECQDLGKAQYVHVAVDALVPATQPTTLRARHAVANQNVILGDVFGFTVREDVAVNAVPHVVVRPRRGAG